MKRVIGDNGFIINGLNAYDKLGLSVSGAGAINGDRKSDIIIGALGETNSGMAYVIFGGVAFGSTFNSDTMEGDNGFVINGLNEDDSLGYSAVQGW